MKHSGSCHCKAVTFETDLDPMLVYQCNCNNCRRLTGGLRVACMYATDEIEFSGETDVYTYSGGSGMNIYAHFCKICGYVMRMYITNSKQWMALLVYHLGSLITHTVFFQNWRSGPVQNSNGLRIVGA